MPNSEKVQNLRNLIRQYLADGVISANEEATILRSGKEAGLNLETTIRFVGEIEKEMGLGYRNHHLLRMKAYIREYIRNDGIIDENEMFTLHEIANKLNINKEQINVLIIEAQKKIRATTEPKRQLSQKDKLGIQTTYTETKPSFKKKSKVFLFVLPITLIAIGLMLKFYPNTNTIHSSKTIRHNQPSEIIYRTILFDKYIVAGNSYMENNGHFSKGVVYYIKGEANVKFNVSQIKRDRDGSLYYVGQSPVASGEVLPYTIEVKISESDRHRVYEIPPKAITPREAKAIGSVVGTLAAVGGGYLGIKAGGLIGNTVNIFSAGSSPFSGLIGSIAGGGLGAAVGGVTGFVLCNKYLTGLSLTPAMTEGDERQILDMARNLIAAELLFDPDLQQEFITAYKNYIEEFYNRQGQSIHIDKPFIKIRAAANI